MVNESLSWLYAIDAPASIREANDMIFADALLQNTLPRSLNVPSSVTRTPFDSFSTPFILTSRYDVLTSVNISLSLKMFRDTSLSSNTSYLVNKAVSFDSVVLSAVCLSISSSVLVSIAISLPARLSQLRARCPFSPQTKHMIELSGFDCFYFDFCSVSSVTKAD